MTFRRAQGGFARGGFGRGAPRAAALAGVALGCFVAAAYTSTNARGASAPSRVVLVRERGADPVIDRAEVRLAAELRAAGFEVEEKLAESDADARQLVDEPGDEGPFATVLLRRAGGRAATEVWVADHVTHKTVVRRFGAQGGESSDRALALRVVELMRASLVEPLVLPQAAEPEPSTPTAPASPAPAPAAATPTLPPDVLRWAREPLREPVPPAPPRVGFGVGIVGAYAGPDITPSLGPQLRVAWHATRVWSVGMSGATVFGGDAPSRTQGTASVRQDIGLLELVFEPPTDAPVHFLATAGAGVYHLYVEGAANPGYTSLRDDKWTGLGALGVGVRWRLTSAASLVVDARELFALPRPVIDFGSERVAEAMHPGTLGALSLAVDL